MAESSSCQHRYVIQDRLGAPAAAHHESPQKLWETKWRAPAEMGVYPFMFGTATDFEPVFTELIKQGVKEPYDWDGWAASFFPQAEALTGTAAEAEAKGDKDKASEYYLRSSALYRIARFPLPRSAKQQLAWNKGKEAAIRGLGLRPHPVRELRVPHPHAVSGEADSFPVYYLAPQSPTPAPCLVILCGLDGYRTELAVWMEGWRKLGVATVVLEVPGTGDSPALPSDPTSPDRQWSSLLDWLDGLTEIDSRRIVFEGFSTGGFYAIRLAHTHHERLLGVVALGGGCHHMFDYQWLDAVNQLEYPFDLANALAFKFGYGDDVERFKREASARFSLLNDGTLDKPCARLLLVNGIQDEIYPIDDYYLALEHGSPKEARFVAGTKHMGEPESFFIILNWLYRLFGIEANPAEQLKSLPFKPRF
ncbi:hypothetical protein XA68_13259 [Ophiocordyceps unilateralis]|uniref:AB hydrolase-1 domain-containing protein n=1 Tax=Ophiocordyceps unilateralis TaxID=268505 RepID=A0A2A9PNR3_OPHUN|nr:hypothetical protein XA68_13259 [Ophiocordyceps unilateralis]